MLTLKHFMDRPTWAAAAGYQFNYFDCMAHTANLYGNVFAALRDVCVGFPDTEVRELPGVIIVLIAAIAGIIVWPLIFWVVAIQVWLKCRRMRRRYHFGGDMTNVAKNNLAVWMRNCDRKWGANQ
ncbi:hypothetical protein ACQR8F_00080 [Klebsiella pneumoniae]|uniref:hypothetical protein n=1 Tax=Klebsiella/Raoultella group TaxID=2890311 RepID=UPI00209E6A76|nr:hypothetical protein [Klebsiella pneumoniae]MCP1089039.1 hypothetical protein [Klebsiella pneumoniae]